MRKMKSECINWSKSYLFCIYKAMRVYALYAYADA